MSEPINRLNEVFESDAFGKFAPLFLEKPTTAMVAAEQSHISRQTIVSQLKKLDSYIESKYSPKVKGKPLKLKSAILTDYLAQKLNLDKTEKETLSDIVENPKINPIIIKDNETICTAVTKVILTILLIGVLRYPISVDTDIVSLSFVDTLLGEFLRSKVVEGKKFRRNKKEKPAEGIKVQVLSQDNIRFFYSSLAEKKEDFDNYESEIKKYAKIKNESEFDRFDALLFALRRSNLPIITYPGTWYEVLCFTIEPSLHYPEYLKRKYSAESARIRRYGTPKGKKYRNILKGR